MAIKATRNGGGNGDDGYGLIGGDAPQRRNFSADDIVIGGPEEGGSAPTPAPRSMGKGRTARMVQRSARTLDYLTGSGAVPISDAVQDSMIRTKAVGAAEAESEALRSQGKKVKFDRQTAANTVDKFLGASPAGKLKSDSLQYTRRGPAFKNESEITLARQDYAVEKTLKSLMRPMVDRPREIARRNKDALYTGPGERRVQRPVTTTTLYNEKMDRDANLRNKAAREDRTSTRQGYEGLFSASQVAEAAISKSPALTGRQYAFGLARTISNAQGGLSGYGGAAAMGALAGAQEVEQRKKSLEEAAAKEQEQKALENAPSMEQLQSQVASAKASIEGMLAPPSTPYEKSKETRSKNTVRKAAYKSKMEKARREEKSGAADRMQGYAGLFPPTAVAESYIRQDQQKVIAQKKADLRAAAKQKRDAKKASNS